MHRATSPSLLACAALLALASAMVGPRAAPPPPAPKLVVDPLRHAGYRERLPGTKVAFDLAPVPGGVYARGSAPGEKGRREDEGPRHLVRVRPFWMATTETTWDLYDLYRADGVKAMSNSERDNDDARAKDADAITRPTQPYPDETRGFGHDGYPALGMTHHAAMEFCRWLSRKTGKPYRLPTEAEWEWACRAGSTTAYGFGDDPARLGDHAWFEGNSEESTHPVGKKKPNAWGLYDLHGSVAEWCLDHYRKDAYAAYPRRALTLNPVLLPTAARYSHVVRGGSWADPASRCRSATRRGSEPRWNLVDPEKPQSLWWLWNADFVGFRVVRAVEEQANLIGLRSKVKKSSE